MIQYRSHRQPGCGGCFFILCLILLASGGAPLLFDFFGFILMSGLLLLLFAVVGIWSFTYYIRRQVGRYEQSQTEAHNRFVFLLVNILIKIAQIDGTVTKEETTTIVNFFRHNLRYNQSQLFWVRDLIKEALQANYTLDELLADFRHNFAHDSRLILLELIYQVVFTNERVSEREHEIIDGIARYLEIPLYAHQSIRARYMGRRRAYQTEDDRHFAVLGLEPGVDFQEVKSAYRKMSMEYHPDKVNHLGEEFRRVAEEKMKEINAAYAYLKQKYGQ